MCYLSIVVIVQPIPVFHVVIVTFKKLISLCHQAELNIPTACLCFDGKVLRIVENMRLQYITNTSPLCFDNIL